METPSPHDHPSQKHFSPVSFVAGLLIALAVFFMIYQLTPHTSTAEKKMTVKDSIKTEQQAIAANKDGIDFTGEHFYRDHHHRHIDKDAEAIVVSPGEMATLEKGNLSAKQKKLLELLPNAPVIYLFDLKITDYQNLYFTAGEPVKINDKVMAAQLLHDAMKDFSGKDFTACFDKMTTLATANPDDVNALFYGGMAAYYKKDLTKALLFFEKVNRSANNIFSQEAHWFSALAYLENGKRDVAIPLLTEIITGSGFYAQKAAQKLKQLN
ncbi:MAG TPA: hypothetical protein VNY73_05345 [Bacteroidia bacterium]|jgi:hypothetical protein|nr:hypothetical protein [Bacteroidia bacterium]